MILVADSGSTKCDWVGIEGATTSEVQSTMGFNPFFHSPELIATEIKKQEYLNNSADKINLIYYYGAGASSDERKAIIESGLQKVFTKAKIEVGHDMLGAALATCNSQEGIVCILGTGSNSCHFKDGITTQHVPALGYILGDEGSGAYFGKKLITNYLYKKLPKHIDAALTERYDLTPDEVLDRIYRQENANVYLASFMRFLSDHREDEFVKEFIYKGFSDFISRHVWKHPNYSDLPVHFVGSIAYYFEELLREEGKIHRINIGKVVKQPIFNLVKHHCGLSVTKS